MIKVSLKNILFEKEVRFKNQDKELKITVEGHANYAAKGSDTVCAAISAIVQTSVLAISKVAGIKQKVKQKNGFLETSIVLKKLSDLEINNLKVILNTMFLGLNEIKENYQNSIIITSK